MTTNASNGITNVSADNIFGALKELDATQLHTFFNDFDTFTAANWVNTSVGASTVALIDGNGGVLSLTNDAADNDLVALQLANETFKFEVGKRLFFKTKLAINDATLSSLVIGLQIRNITPLGVSDGVYFAKPSGAATLNFNVVKNSTATTASAIASVTADTYITLAFMYDGISKIYYAAGSDSNNPTILGKSVVTNLPDDEDLTISFAIQNGAAAIKTMVIDYIFCAKER